MGRPRHASPSKEAKRKRAERARRDTGTAELAMYRARLTGGSDPTLSTHPLDIMLAKGQIDGRQNQAGWIYYRLRRKVVGAHEPCAARYDEYIAAGAIADAYLLDVAADRARWDSYFQAERALRDIGWRYYRATRNLILAQEISLLEIPPARIGLDALAKLFKCT